MGFQLNTDFSGIAPDEGGGRSYFPISDSKGWLVQITASEGKETNAKDGTRLDMVLTGLEGPVTGRTMDWSINVANKSQRAVEIGFGQMSAIAHVTGHIKVGNSVEWHNKPFRVVVVSDATEQYPNATKIAKILDVNGNSAKDAGKGVMGGQQQGNFNQQQTGQNSFQGNGGNGSQQSQQFAGQQASNAGNQQQPQGQQWNQQQPGNGQAVNGVQSGGFNPQTQGQQAAQFNPNAQQNGNFQQQQPQQNGQFQQTNSNGPGWNQ